MCFQAMRLAHHNMHSLQSNKASKQQQQIPTMATPSSSRLTRRHASPTGSTPNGSSSSSGDKFHPSSRKHVSTKLLAVTALSFLGGLALHTPTNSMKKVSRIEAGFEPPNVRVKRKESRDDRLNLRDNNKAINIKSNTMQQQRPQQQQPKQQPKPQQPNKRRQPRTIAIQISSSKVLTYQIPTPSIEFQDETLPEGYPIEPSWYESNAAYFMDGVDFDQCEPMEEWQLSSFVDCNKFHELDLSNMRMINRGGSRIAFELTQSLPLSKEIFKFVYKTMRYGKEIDTHQIEQQRKDSLVMERTTSSQFIPSIHGYCSLAVMMDFMPEGNMHDYIKGSRILSREVNGAHGVEDKSGKLLKPVDRLRVGIHIATSVADLHGIDGTKQPSYFHNDLCCHQYLFEDGVFKLNDFNYARPIYMDKTTHKACTRFSYGMMHYKARSLEEHIKVQRLPLDPPVPDKIDVWMMGNIIYYILTDLYTFEKPENLNNDEVGKLLVQGKRSPYPEYIEKSSDPAHIAMKKALDMCWVQNWRERPSAREISDYMLSELRKITGEENPDLRVVLPERDPNQSPSDGEYEEFND